MVRISTSIDILNRRRAEAACRRVRPRLFVARDALRALGAHTHLARLGVDCCRRVKGTYKPRQGFVCQRPKLCSQCVAIYASYPSIRSPSIDAAGRSAPNAPHRRRTATSGAPHPVIEVAVAVNALVFAVPPRGKASFAQIGVLYSRRTNAWALSPSGGGMRRSLLWPNRSTSIF
eukprot:COSAG05_NODE_2520_length_2950_cov_1.329358_1_plen_175_part_00